MGLGGILLDDCKNNLYSHLYSHVKIELEIDWIQYHKFYASYIKWSLESLWGQTTYSHWY